MSLGGNTFFTQRSAMPKKGSPVVSSPKSPRSTRPSEVHVKKDASEPLGVALSQHFPAISDQATLQAPNRAEPGASAASLEAGNRAKESTPAAAAATRPSPRGVIDINKRTAAVLEIFFSIVALTSFLALWIYMLTAACFQNAYNIFFLKLFSILGAIVSLFCVLHSSFDRSLTIGRGIFGCIVFFIINIAVFLNLVGAFLAVNCSCICPSTMNAFEAKSNHDRLIFYLELCSSICLIIVLTISAVQHR